jgi:hypothetical protein
MTKARYDGLIIAAVCNFTVHTSDGLSQEQRDAEFAVVEKEWDEAKKSPDTFEAWQTAQRKKHVANFEELMVALREKLDDLLREFDDLFGNYASIIIRSRELARERNQNDHQQN